MLKNYNRPWFFFSVSIIIPWVLWFLAGYLSHRTDSENHIWLQSMLMLSGLLAPIFTALFLYLKNPILLQDLDLFDFIDCCAFWFNNSCSAYFCVFLIFLGTILYFLTTNFFFSFIFSLVCFDFCCNYGRDGLAFLLSG